VFYRAAEILQASILEEDMDRSSNLMTVVLAFSILFGGFLYLGPSARNSETGKEGPPVGESSSEHETWKNIPGSISILEDLLFSEPPEGIAQWSAHEHITQIKSRLSRGNLHLLIVTLPDWVDSHSRWYFDGLVDALQKAAAEGGFLIDRYYLPDAGGASGVQTASSAEPDSKGVLHERDPGAILFRRIEGSEIADLELLEVLLVPETPVSGVHRPALEGAIELAMEFQAPSGSDSPAVVRILGPTFSGSSPSLALSLRKVSQRHPSLQFRIVSGSATNPANKGLLENSAPGKVLFQGTVLPDDFVAPRLETFVRNLLPGTRDTIARLV